MALLGTASLFCGVVGSGGRVPAAAAASAAAVAAAATTTSATVVVRVLWTIWWEIVRR
jgi:hypothetical protein